MAALGSAVGLGNLWSFPYKLGMGGGFAFLLIYIILCVVVGYPLMLSEITLGRKTQKAAIEAYKEAHRSFTFNGVLQTVVPFFLICFYCTFGGYITKYLASSIAALFSSDAALNTGAPGDLFGGMISSDNALVMVAWMFFFLALTTIIVLGGVSNGIEKFCKVAMPALFVMLVIIVIRSCTLPGAGEGLKFLFSPDLDMWKKSADGSGGFMSVLGLAGGQMFFSLSLASGCIIAYGSYLDKHENLERDAAVITLGDSLVAILAGMAIMPAVFAFGLEPGAGPGLLFVSMTAVFQSMGFAGRIFQLMFWLLVFFAALSSSIGMMEGGISAIMDTRIKAGKSVSRMKTTFVMAIVAFAGNFMTTYDCLGGNDAMSWARLFGRNDVLTVWDTIAEGILMPLTGLIMAILIGWVIPGYLDDEVESSSSFKTKRLFRFCIKYIGPLFMALVIFNQFQKIMTNTL